MQHAAIGNRDQQSAFSTQPKRCPKKISRKARPLASRLGKTCGRRRILLNA